jgi:hypothetical protein
MGSREEIELAKWPWSWWHREEVRQCWRRDEYSAASLWREREREREREMRAKREIRLTLE